MALYKRPAKKPWLPRRQPTVPVEVDWDNPMTRNLEWLIIFNNANPAELVRNETITISANLSRKEILGSQGLGDFLGTGADNAQVSYQLGWDTGAVTIMSMHRLATGQNGSQSMLVAPGGNDPCALYHDGWGNRRILLLRRWRTFAHLNAAGYLGADTVYRVLAAHPGGTINSGPARIMVNGDIDSITRTETESITPGSGTFYLGNNDSINNEFDGQLFMQGAWSRELSDDEMLAWDRDPYQIVKPRTIRQWFTSTGAPPAARRRFVITA